MAEILGRIERLTSAGGEQQQITEQNQVKVSTFKCLIKFVP